MQPLRAGEGRGEGERAELATSLTSLPPPAARLATPTTYMCSLPGPAQPPHRTPPHPTPLHPRVSGVFEEFSQRPHQVTQLPSTRPPVPRTHPLLNSRPTRPPCCPAALLLCCSAKLKSTRLPKITICTERFLNFGVIHSKTIRPNLATNALLSLKKNIHAET